jgi:hypothetical protein
MFKLLREAGLPEVREREKGEREGRKRREREKGDSVRLCVFCVYEKRDRNTEREERECVW